jgi:cytochrome b561
MIIVLLPALFTRIRTNTSLSSKSAGPLLSTEALDQLALHFVIYFILLIVPIGGSISGKAGPPIALGSLFLIIVSLMIRFKKLGND